MHTNQKYEDGCKMLDWDFKKPNFERHLQKVKDHDFEVVMSMDITAKNEVEDALKFTNQLLKYTNRVVIPIHYFDKRLADYELAFPNTTKFNPNSAKNLGFITDFQDQVTHILGGSPDKQIDLLNYFPNVVSLDGNSIFWVAVRYGKAWKNKWVKIEGLTNEEIFKQSIYNLNNIFGG